MTPENGRSKVGKKGKFRKKSSVGSTKISKKRKSSFPPFLAAVERGESDKFGLRKKKKKSLLCEGDDDDLS